MASDPFSDPMYYVDDNNVRGWEEPPRNRTNNVFEKVYICYPIVFIEKYHLEGGNKIIMPESALEILEGMVIEYPMLFEIKNPNSGRVSHCGVLEFTAGEDIVFMPKWMMKNMKLEEGDLVNLKSIVSLPKGEYMKIQPHEMKFAMNLDNPEDVLLAVMKDFTCVTAGDTIMIDLGGQKYYVDILETKPSNAILLYETDCEVDFATALDYKEPEKTPTTVIKRKNEKTEKVEEKAQKKAPKFKAFTGVARRLDGETVLEEVESLRVAEEEKNNITDKSKLTSPNNDKNLGFGTDKGQEKAEKEEPKFKAFTGAARRLDGETVLEEVESLRVAEEEKNNTTDKSKLTSPNSDKNLGFGMDKGKEKAEKEEPKFKAFTCAARQLDGETKLKEEECVAKEERDFASDEFNVTSRKRDRNLAFGTDYDVQKPAKKVVKEDVQDKSPNVEGEKWKPFTGKKYTLEG